MTCFRAVVLTAGIVLMARCADPAFAARESQPEDALKSHGLRVRSGGSTYVLAAESEIQLKLNDAQRIYRQLSLALRKRYEYEQALQARRQIVPRLLEQRMLLRRQIDAVGRQNVALHNELAAQFNDVNDQLNLIQLKTSDPRIKQDIDSEVSERRAHYIRALAELRALVDSTHRRYAELAQNDTITAALTALRSKSGSPVKLGPSRGFDDSVRQLKSREKAVLSQAIEMRRKGGVFEIDVTLNGKETVSMIFDTGASLVTLPFEFAQKIGLEPQPADPIVELHDASGGVTKATKMTIATIQVGPFTAQNVECAVMPPEKRDVPLLLGQSFINQFMHRVEGDRLLLSNIETPELEPKALAPPKRSTRAKRSGKAARAAQSHE